MQVVWFKRDLRINDHRALSAAAECGEVLPIFVVEPDLWREADMPGRQWAFVEECLHELRQDLKTAGQSLIVRIGDVVEVLAGVHKSMTISALWSHEETGNAWTYSRDKRVAAWCRTAGVVWHEIQNHGVQRRLTQTKQPPANPGRFICRSPGKRSAQIGF